MFMAKVIEHIKKEKLDELIEAGYIDRESVEQILADALSTFKRQMVRNKLNRMDKRDFKRLMEKTPAPIRSSRNRKRIREGWQND